MGSMHSAAALLLALAISAPDGELKALGGPQPAPLRAPHFPRPLDEYVFRNWGAVPLERIARAIGAEPSQVRELAGEMGLGDPPEISPEVWRRSYLTVIRRNWHLLPYEQLLALLGWDEGKLAFILREDDFLWTKLGSLKPRCPPLSFEPIPEALRPRFETIRRTMSDVLGPRGLSGFRRRFGFLDDLQSTAEISSRTAPSPGAGEVSLQEGWTLALPEGAGEVARGAAQRFAAFLKDVMGARPPELAEPGRPLAAPPPGGGAIELVLTPQDFSGPESHQIAVEPGRIRISARDEVGLLRGLDRLKDRFEERGGPFLLPGRERRDVRFSLRFLYSYSALYGDPLTEPDLDPYPDGYLEKLSRLGVNGVWLQALLRNLGPEPAPGSAPVAAALLPEPGGKSETRLVNLKALVARARRFGISVYLYLNEPRALPPAAFAAHPELGGVSEGPLRTLCTSVPAVRESISAVLAHLFARVPNLGGVFTITMSENLTSCWSHQGGKGCPRCAARPARVASMSSPPTPARRGRTPRWRSA